MKVALVLTVKNESRILRQNLEYHRYLGAAIIFVYFDDTTDAGPETIADLDYVRAQPSVDYQNYTHLDFLNKFTTQAQEHHTARQCLNAYDALEECKAMGIDWLISIDADELVCLHETEIIKLPDFFKNIDTQTNVVQLMPLEMLQTQLHFKEVFKEAVLFKAQAHFKPKRFGVFKTIYNPFTKKQQRFSYWYGQHLGKAAVRVSSQPIPHNVHKFKNSQGQVAHTEKLQGLLHYHAYDTTDFIKKFKNFSNHPDTFLSGNKVEDLKLLLRDVVNQSNISDNELEVYFKENLMFTNKEIKALQRNRVYNFFKRKEPVIKQVTAVQQVFRNLNYFG